MQKPANNHPLQTLISQLIKLPSVGEKSAQRLAFFFIGLPLSEIKEFSQVLVSTKENIKYCEKCYNLSWSTQCFICQDTTRVTNKLCVVADPRAIMAIERTKEFQGLYHVLGGLLSPLDRVYPETLRINELITRLHKENFSEIILAINPTIEGDATILYLTKLLAKFEIPITKLAYGLPIGADIDYTDELTLQKAFTGRTGIDGVKGATTL